MLFHEHALEQFTTRYDRSLTQDQARELLERATRYKSEKTRTGEQYWDVPDLGVRLITKPGRLPQDRGQEVCVTIVSQGEKPIGRGIRSAMLESEHEPEEDLWDQPEDHVDANAKVKVRGWVTYEIRVEVEFPELNQNERNTKVQGLQNKFVDFARRHTKKAGVRQAKCRVTKRDLKVVKDDGMGNGTH